MNIKENLNYKDFNVGVLVARFQVNELHSGHRELLDYISSRHKKVILFLGVPRIKNTKRNPLDFASRKIMVQKNYPNIVILPLNDQRYNDKWSRELDGLVSVPFGEVPTLLYGSRDSFIPYYTGKFPTIELEPSVEYNGTDIRDELSKEIIDSPDFRAGIVHATYAQRACTFPTVDIVVYNDEGEILLAKKPNEKYWRFVGGFVDRDDVSYEAAAKRELNEETGGNLVIGEPKYVLSHKVDDWRYAKEESGIMTTLFMAHRSFGMASASDDIETLIWLPINELSHYHGIRTLIMPEHREMMQKFIDKVYSENLIPNIGERLPEYPKDITYTIE